MSLTDFLFEGTPPPSTTRYGETVESVPPWYSDYMQGLLSRGNAIAGEEYAGYTGPRVAGFTGDQNAAFANTRSNVGIGDPSFDAAGSMLRSGTADSAAAARPGITRAGALSSTAMASPYMRGADKSFTGDTVDDYMNPYMDKVVDRIAREGNRNLTERLLPDIQDQFVAAGQSGSTRAAEFGSRALRDTQQAIEDAQAGALAKGYDSAGQLFGADANRQGALATTAGNMTTADRDALLRGADLEGRLTGETADRSITAGDKMGALGTTRQTAGLRDAAALEAIGSTEQQQGQRNLDTAYDRFVEERDYPRDNAAFMNSMLRGLQVPTRTDTSSTGPASNMMGPSLLAQVAGAGTGLAGYAELFKKRGGRVQRGGALAQSRGSNLQKMQVSSRRPPVAAVRRSGGALALAR